MDKHASPYRYIEIFTTKIHKNIALTKIYKRYRGNGLVARVFVHGGRGRQICVNVYICKNNIGTNIGIINMYKYGNVLDVKRTK